MTRRLRFGLSLAGSAFAFGICLIILRVWQGPCGYDVYYYALQTKALTLEGELLFSDHSLVYRVLYLVNLLLNNPILSVQVLASFCIALLFFCLLAASFRTGASLYKTAVAVIAIFNPGTFYLLLEFTKNNFAFALFFLAWLLLTDEENRLLFNSANHRPPVRLFSGLLILCIAVLSHRLILALLLCFIAQKLFVFLLPRFKKEKILIICAAIAAVLSVVAFIFLGKMILERLEFIGPGAFVHRFVQLFRSPLLKSERIFYITLQISVFFLIPYIAIKDKWLNKSCLVFAATGWLFLFPFLHFTWDGLGFRLLILAPVMLAPAFMQMRPRFPKVIAMILIVASIWFTSESVQHLAFDKGPDYRAYKETFKSIEAMVKGRRLIVHRGLAGFLWYEKGIRSENFRPLDGEDRYLRMVYAFSPEIFESYLEADDPMPLSVNNTYTLMEEKIWQRFYRDRQDLFFLKSELNPFLPRPVSGFVINEKIAALLSPVSDFPE